MKFHSSFTPNSIVQSLWNFAQSMAVSMPCSVQNFVMIRQQGKIYDQWRYCKFWLDVFSCNGPRCHDLSCDMSVAVSLLTGCFIMVKSHESASHFTVPLCGESIRMFLNSLSPERYINHFQRVIYQYKLMRDIMGIFGEIALSWIPQELW